MDIWSKADEDRIKWMQEVNSAPKVVVYFPADVQDGEGWFYKTTQYFNYCRLDRNAAKEVLSGIEAKVADAMKVDGSNGKAWENDLIDVEEGLLRYLGFKGYYTNTGINCYLEIIMPELLVK